MSRIRLNRFVALCGAAARRKADELIFQGRVRVDGKIVVLPAFQVDPDVMKVTLDGKPLVPERSVYLVINKPQGVVSAVSDKYDPVVVDLLPERWKSMRVFPVGRLDRDSEGLLILSNDGEFAQELIHPSATIEREYEVLLDRAIGEKSMAQWRSGFTIEGRFLKPHALEVMSQAPEGCWVRVVLGEGVKREVRTMAKLSGYKVLTLIRRRIGKLVLKNLSAGQIVDLPRAVLWGKILEGGEV